MDSKLARNFLILVNDPVMYNKLCEYANFRIEYLKEELVKAQDIKTVTFLQGQINEIKKILTLKAEVQKRAEDNGHDVHH